MESQNPSSNIIRKLTFSNSDSSDKVMDYGSISKQADQFSSGDMSIRVDNADQYWNVVETDKTHFLRPATVDVGFTINNSDEVLTVFTGNLTRIRNSGGAKVNLTFRDKMNPLKKRSIGSSNSGSQISFTGSDWNPADMFWTIVTSWGRLSEVASTSNPDIDYSAWLDWKTNLTVATPVTLQGYFEGDSVVNALEKIAELTNSIIIAEGNGKIFTYKFVPELTTSPQSYSDDNIIEEIEREINVNDLVNDAKVLFAYNPSSDTWGGEVTRVVTSSVNTYGVYNKVYDDTTIWHSTSASANNFLLRHSRFLSEPIEKISFNTNLRGLIVKMGDSIEVTNAILSYNAVPFKIVGSDIDMNTGMVEIDAEEDYDSQNWFFLDHATLGLLDQSYNPIF
jgi:hypothetical protein